MQARAASGRSEVRRWRLPSIEQVRHHQSGQEWVPHWHDEWSFGAVLQGECRFSHSGNLTRAAAGDCLAIAPGVVHTGALVRNDEARPVLVVMFYVQPEWLQRQELAPPPDFAMVHAPSHARRAGEVFEAKEASEWVAKLIPLLGNAPIGSRSIARPTPAAQRLLSRFYAGAMHGHTSVGSLAQHCGVSRERVLKVVRQWTGLSPSQYLRALRVNLARERVLNGESVASAAAACGFADQAHFTRWFVRSFGYSPGDLLRAARKRL